MGSKKGIETYVLIKWLIVALVLVLVVAGIAANKNEAISVWQRITEILRFR